MQACFGVLAFLPEPFLLHAVAKLMRPPEAEAGGGVAAVEVDAVGERGPLR